MRGLRAMIAAAALAAFLSACGDDGDSPTTASPTTPTTTPSERPEPPRGRDSDGEQERGPGGRSEASEVTRTVRDYVRALDGRDGERVCDLLAPRAIDAVDLPRDRGTCTASMTASIG